MLALTYRCVNFDKHSHPGRFQGMNGLKIESSQTEFSPVRALQVTEIGQPPSLVESPAPAPGPGEVQIAVAACGLNFADLLMIEGHYQDTPPVPFTLGMELCGTVTALGEGVTGPAPGTRVIAFAGQGGLADTACVPAALCRPVPEEMPSDIAAGFQVAYGTSHLALDRRARLRTKETLVVLGAAGGVGLTAVEIGKLMGAQVVAVARGPEKLAIARAAGADHLIDAEADLTAELRALGGADVVYDAVGGAAFSACLRAMKREGRILAIGFASGDVPQVPANHLLVKNVDVIGVYWGGYLAFAPDVLMDSLDTLMSWYAEGRLSPHVGHVLPLDRAEDALDLLRSRRSTGKVVVTP